LTHPVGYEYVITMNPPTASTQRASRGAVVAPPVRAAVAGATGYSGQELVRLLARHPALALEAAMSSGETARRLPALARIWDEEVAPLDRDRLASAEVVFLALPDTAAAEFAPALVDAGVRVVDLSGAFRLRDDALRARWYPDTKRMPPGVVYGLTERAYAALPSAQLVANPGCYPTASLLATAPLGDAGLLQPGSDIIVDAKSGVSGAGKTPTARTHFVECHDSVSAYGVFGHRHGAEIEQGVGNPVVFTPHLIPVNRGILATIYVRLKPGTTEAMLGDAYTAAYATAPMVRLRGADLPEIKHVVNSNFCDIGWRVDGAGRAVLVSVIDNLLKGAASQAVQNVNVMFGLSEETGLL
jgi:N-acetyl-gamma-glutamyl-phosphate reductase